MLIKEDRKEKGRAGENLYTPYQGWQVVDGRGAQRGIHNRTCSTGCSTTLPVPSSWLWTSSDAFPSTQSGRGCPARRCPGPREERDIYEERRVLEMEHRLHGRLAASESQTWLNMLRLLSDKELSQLYVATGNGGGTAKHM